MHTDHSPKEKFIVRAALTEDSVWWEANGAISSAQFDALLADFIDHARGRELFAQDLHAGADPSLQVKTRVFTELAWYPLFIRNLLTHPDFAELTSTVPNLIIVDMPSSRAEPSRHGSRTETVIECDFSRRIVLIGGTSYAGEIKKAVFTI
jgi:phosphoenolpyruvate carboxykinase (ATP)